MRTVTEEEVKFFFDELHRHSEFFPELNPMFEAVHDDRAHATNIFNRYLKIIDKIPRLINSDKKTVAMLGNGSSASHMNAAGLLDALGRKNIGVIDEIFSSVLDSQKPDLWSSLAELAVRLAGGHNMKMANHPPLDGDPQSDNVIWGHTLISNPEALIHFTTAHFLERYFDYELGLRNVDIETEKDFLINAMSDVLALDHAGAREFDDIFTMWTRSREEGGLSWNGPKLIEDLGVIR